MSERETEFSPESCCLSPLTTLLDSLKIFPRNLRLFFSIFAVTTLPLSVLLFSLSFSSYPIKSHVYQLEALAALSATRFEAGHVWKESRADALSLLRLKALYAIPCYALSLLAAITAVNSAAMACSGKRPTLETAVTAVKHTWRRPLVTTICVYMLMLAYVQIPRTLAVLVSNPGLRLIFLLLGSGLEVYLMAVMSLALVVSIAEDRFGFEAIRVGSDLMEGRRASGWVLSGLFVWGSGMVSCEMEGTVESEDLPKGGWTVAMKWLWERVGFICLFGLVVLWSYVVTTVFYCECRRRHVIKEEGEGTV